ncbi:MAG: helix-turn-helix transcriptional regulator [Coriobacteriales bacterium]|jgi:DNA-binding CsgD family transcriptional regulator
MQLRRHTVSTRSGSVLPLLGLGPALAAMLCGIVCDSPLVESFGTVAYRPLLMGALLGAAMTGMGTVVCALPTRGKHPEGTDGASGSHAWAAIDAGDSLGHRTATHGHLAPALALAVALLSLACVGALAAGWTTGTWARWVAGAALGAALAEVGLLWGMEYARVGFRSLVAASAGSFAVALVLVAVALAAVPAGPASALYVGVLCVVSAIPLMALQDAAVATDEGKGSRKDDRRDGEAGGRPQTERAGKGTAASATPRADIARGAWQPVLLATIIAWVFGMVWGPSMTPNPERLPDAYDLSLLTGQALGCVAYLAIAWPRRGREFLPVASTVVLPLVAAVYLLFPTIAGSVFVPASFALNALTWACLAIVFLSVWTQLARAAKAEGRLPVSSRRLPSPLAIMLVACSLAACAAMALVGTMGAAGQAISLVLFAGYFVLTVISYGRDARRGAAPEPSPEDPVAAGVSAYERRCAEVCSAYGLSPRESEVLAYLGKGHSQAYVAAELGVTESTVHTHARKIYSKLGVSSKEQLIVLMTGTGQMGHTSQGNAGRAD